MRRWLSKIKRRKIVFLLAASALLLASLVVILMTTRNTEQNAANYYIERLNLIKANLKTINSPPDDSSDTSSAKIVAEYSKVIDELTTQCQLMTLRSKQPSQQKFVKIKNSVESAVKLCQDLTPIAQYQSSLYSRLEEFLVADFSKMTADASAKTIASTQQYLKDIDNSVVNDPALPELQTQLQAISAEAQVTQSANSENLSTQSTFYKHLITTKTNLLNARYYFWNNTVQMALLQASVDKLITDFDVK